MDGRDEWLIGDALGLDGKRREYVVHLQPPRFVARVVACDDDGLPEPPERPADILTGMVYTGDVASAFASAASVIAPAMPST